MTAIERAARALADALRSQEPQHGGTFFVDADNLRETVIDGKFDLHALGCAVIAAVREALEDRQAGVDTAAEQGESAAAAVEASRFQDAIDVIDTLLKEES